MANEEDSFKELVDECTEIIESCGFTLPEALACKLYDKMMVSIARCKRDKTTDVYIIEIVAPYFKEYLKRDMKKRIKEIILHELCHALPDGMNHRGKWKEYITKVNKLGYNITTHIEIDDVIVDVYRANVKKVYVIQCKDCGVQTRYHRKTRAVTNLHEYSCSLCGGDLKLLNKKE